MIWSLVLGIVVSLLVVEFTDWCPSIAAGLVRLAARMLPESERDRYREEWLAEVETVPGRLTRIVKAACLLAGIPALRLAIIQRTRPAASDPNDATTRAHLDPDSLEQLTLRPWDELLERSYRRRRRFRPPYERRQIAEYRAYLREASVLSAQILKAQSKE